MLLLCGNYGKDDDRLQSQTQTFSSSRESASIEDTRCRNDMKLLIKGVLKKYSNPINGWQDRFVQIYRSGDEYPILTLQYHEINSNDPSLVSNFPRGTMIIDKVTLITTDKVNPRLFTINDGKKAFYLQAANQSERSNWIEIIEAFKNHSDGLSICKNNSGKLKHLKSTLVEEIKSEINDIHNHARSYFDFVRKSSGDLGNITEMSGHNLIDRMDRVMNKIALSIGKFDRMSDSVIVSFKRQIIEDFEKIMVENQELKRIQQSLYNSDMNEQNYTMSSNCASVSSTTAVTDNRSREILHNYHNNGEFDIKQSNVSSNAPIIQSLINEDVFLTPQFRNDVYDNIPHSATYGETSAKKLVDLDKLNTTILEEEKIQLAKFIDIPAPSPDSDKTSMPISNERKNQPNKFSEAIERRHRECLIRYENFMTKTDQLYKLFKSDGVVNMYRPRIKQQSGSCIKLIFKIQLPAITSYELVYAINDLDSRKVYGKEFDEIACYLKEFQKTSKLFYVSLKKLPLIAKRYAVFMSDYRQVVRIPQFLRESENAASGELQGQLWSSVLLDVEDQHLEEYSDQIKHHNSSKKPIRASSDSFSLFRTFVDQALFEELNGRMIEKQFSNIQLHPGRVNLVTEWFYDLTMDVGGWLPKPAMNFAMNSHLPKFLNSLFHFVRDRNSTDAPRSEATQE